MDAEMETYRVNFIEGETTGVYGISLVNDPAMESMFIALSKEEQFQLKSVDNEQRIVCGAVLIPEKPIYRNQNGKEFNIVFPAQTIKLASENFFKKGYQSSSTIEHDVDSKIKGVTIVESWIKTDLINDKSVVYGMNEPIGTWYASMKIDNDEIWNDFVKTGKVKGFSIDGFFDLEQVNLKTENNMIEQIVDAIKSGFASLNLTKDVKVNLGSVKLADGSMEFNFDGDTVAVGTPMTMTAPDGMELPVPDGEYTLEGGMAVVIANSLVAEISTVEEETTDVEEEAPMNPATPMSAPVVKSEKTTNEIFYQLSKEDFNAMVLEIGNQFETKLNALRNEFETKLSNEVEAVQLTKTKPAKDKTWDEMTSLEKHRALKNN